MKQTQKKFIVLLCANCLCAGFFIFLHIITVNKISDAAISEEKIRNEIIRNESVDIMKKDLGTSIDYEKEMKKYFIGSDESDLANFISALEKFSSDNALKITVNSVSFEDSPKLLPIRAEYARLPISLLGKWENTQNMIRFLENYPYKIELKSVTLQRNFESHDWSESIDFDVARLKN